MKKLFISVFLFYSLGCHAQVVPPLYVPYIHTRPADLEGVRTAAKQKSDENYAEFKDGLNAVFARMVLNVDMLPVDKGFFTKEFNEVRKSHDQYVKENPFGFNFQKNIDEAEAQFNETALNPILIQQAKTRYKRVLTWESYLREKNLIDSPYKNSDELTGLTNKQALNILYGTDMDAFKKLAWE